MSNEENWILFGKELRDVKYRKKCLQHVFMWNAGTVHTQNMENMIIVEVCGYWNTMIFSNILQEFICQSAIWCERIFAKLSFQFLACIHMFCACLCVLHCGDPFMYNYTMHINTIFKLSKLGWARHHLGIIQVSGRLCCDYLFQCFLSMITYLNEQFFLVFWHFPVNRFSLIYTPLNSVFTFVNIVCTHYLLTWGISAIGRLQCSIPSESGVGHIVYTVISHSQPKSLSSERVSSKLGFQFLWFFHCNPVTTLLTAYKTCYISLGHHNSIKCMKLKKKNTETILLERTYNYVYNSKTRIFTVFENIYKTLYAEASTNNQKYISGQKYSMISSKS